ncbi:conserved hypothetical protein [Ricinus communis]|uniref:Uncharacterized protein n=1 Tax=Ricinus communis TaxID=3988 RepID=B9TH29_RICCO|nr:conserved hypothetical protein [Ricinus communis]
MDRLQAEAALVEIVAHVAGEGELAVEIVGPLVIGTDETHRRAVLLGADARAAVTAGIVEGADDIVAAADDDDGILTDLHGEIGARLRQFAIVTHEEPVAVVDHFHIELEIVLVDIEGLLKAEAFAPVFELPQNVAANVHLHILVQSAQPSKAWLSEASGFPPFREHWSWGHLSTGHPRVLVVKRHRLRN